MDKLFADLLAHPEVASAVAALASAVAVILSILSIFVSIRMLSHQRRHDILSVVPLPDITCADYENRVGVKLNNYGPGSMIVKRIWAEGAGEPSESLIEKMPGLVSNQLWTHFIGPVRGARAVAPGEGVVLLQFDGDPANPEYVFARDMVRRALKGLTVHVEFTDVYGSRFRPATRALDWFGRESPSEIT